MKKIMKIILKIKLIIWNSVLLYFNNKFCQKCKIVEIIKIWIKLFLKFKKFKDFNINVILNVSIDFLILNLMIHKLLNWLILIIIIISMIITIIIKIKIIIIKLFIINKLLKIIP